MQTIPSWADDKVVWWSSLIGIPLLENACNVFFDYGRPKDNEYSFQTRIASVVCTPGKDEDHWLATVYIHYRNEYPVVQVHRDTLKQVYHFLVNSENRWQHKVVEVAFRQLKDNEVQN